MAARITVTEALAEIKLIASRIVKKREAIKRYFFRDTRLKDPMKEGSEAYIAQERQAIIDLQKRSTGIRAAIQMLNLTTPLEVNGVTMTVQSWLNWRKEFSAGDKTFLNEMVQTANGVRQEAQRHGLTVSKELPASPDVQTFIINVDEAELSKAVENIEVILGQLDGRLSLFNATHYIEI